MIIIVLIMEEETKAFIIWKDSPKSPFITSYNGEDKTKPRIRYDKNGKFYTLEEVYDYWIKLQKT